MKFDFITIYIQDMDRSIGFYHGLLGLPVLRRHPIEGGELAFLGVEGEPQLELISGLSPAHGGFSIGMAVPSLDEATAMLAQNGHPVIRGPISPNASTRFSFVADPDGIEVELIEYRW